MLPPELSAMRRFLIFLAIPVIAAFTVIRPEDVPDRWNPVAPLDLDEAPNFVSRWKVRTLSRRPLACRDALLRSGAAARFLADREHSDTCHIRNHARIDGLSVAGMAPLGTTCAIAARLYLWERHVLQPAARRLLGTGVVRIEHFDSYSCRPIRTARGISTRMSEHATANAVDIAGFVLADGRRVSVRGDWSGDGPEAAFLRAARDGLCEWFNLVLSPDYNALHADHFHADMGRWPSCR